MAGETRRQRRDARRAEGDAGKQEPRQSVTRAATPAGEPAFESVTASPAVSARRGGFVRESWAELNKVEWPNRAQVIQGTVVVMIAVIVVGAYLWGLDQVFRPFVQNVLL